MDAGKGNGRRTDGQVAAKAAAKTRWTGWAPDCNTTQIQCFNLATCRTKTNILEHALSQHQCSNWLGGVTTYYVGRIGDWKKIEKFFRIKKEKVYSFKEKIDRWGSVAAFFTWLPLGGDILALALGVFKVDALKVSLWMLIGKSIRFFVVGVLIYYGIDLFTN